MSLKIKQQKIPENLKSILDKLNGLQHELWSKYINFLSVDQLQELNDLVVVDKNLAKSILSELEKKYINK